MYYICRRLSRKSRKAAVPAIQSAGEMRASVVRYWLEGAVGGGPGIALAWSRRAHRRMATCKCAFWVFLDQGWAKYGPWACGMRALQGLFMWWQIS